ncbi:MAG TPA: D-alanyl-D-alanine carboxypeptidase, partial [Tissierella sp.]|nr:D-alanyl-D-alanine carboxypeptidase [Tissierella sp.]
FCLSASAKRGNLELIAVVMGVNNSKLRFDEAKRMLDYGFANYESITIGKKGDIIATLPVEKGKLKEVDLMLSQDSHILLPKGEKAELIKDIILPDALNAPILAGDEVGELVISIDGKESHKVKIIAKTNVEKANLFNMLNKTIKNYLSIR